MKKNLHNTNVTEAQANTPDLKISGDGDLWVLLCKASSENEGWMKSTKAMEIPGVGCVVQVTTEIRGDCGQLSIAEAVTFVPHVYISIGTDGKKRLRMYGWIEEE